MAEEEELLLLPELLFPLLPLFVISGTNACEEATAAANSVMPSRDAAAEEGKDVVDDAPALG